MTKPTSSETAAAIRILLALGRTWDFIPPLHQIDLDTDYGRDLVEAIRIERLVYRRDRDSEKRLARMHRQRDRAGTDDSGT